jgi:hypothetical protein
MKASHKRKLDAKDADSLIKYTRLIRELETEETREVEQEVARKLAEEASKPNE